MVQFINWWEDYGKNIQDSWFKHFFQRCCEDIEGINHDDIRLYTVFGSTHNIITSDQTKANIYFTGENTHFMHTQYQNEEAISNHVDVVCSFFKKSSKSIRFPLWLIYWNFQTNGLFNIPVDTTRKDKAIIAVNHNAGGFRTNIVQQILNQDIGVDSNKLHVIPNATYAEIGIGSQGKIETLKNYKYNICCENSVQDSYTTEKIFECFAGGCIPIYSGMKPVEPNVLYQDNIIYVNDLSSIDIKTLIFNGDKVWKEDALLYIYSTYLKVWSMVYKKLGKKPIKQNGIQFIDYVITTENDAIDCLKQHWLSYNHFFTPRPRFVLDSKLLYAEDIADKMYELYHL